MRIRYAILILVAISAAVVYIRPPVTPRLKPVAQFTSSHPVGAWDSVAVVGDDLWVTDNKRGEIVVLDTKSGGQRKIGTEFALVEPNGIAALKGETDWTVYVVDQRQAEVLCLSAAGSLLGRFGKEFFTEPRGIAAFEKDKKTHLLVTDQGKLRGCVWHIVLEGTAPVTRTSMAPIDGQVESVAYAASENLVLVADETHRRIEYFALDATERAGYLGAREFKGEPEGLAVWAEAGVIFAVDQTADARILCFEEGLQTPRLFKSEPPLVEPDGACRKGDTLYVVSGDRAVYAFRFAVTGN